MFHEIGKKLMLIGKVCAFAFPALTLIVSFSLLLSGSTGVWLSLAAGALLSLGAWVLVGFGQLVQDVHDLRTASAHINAPEDELPNL